MKNLIYMVVVLLSTCYSLSAQEVQRVRIDLETSFGHNRQLLLGFTSNNSATDGFDYGYDAAGMDNFPDDFKWIIDKDSYIIQGVGKFETTKKYPIGFFLSNNGDIKISLNSLENFQRPIDVFVFDAYKNTYTSISDQSFTTYKTAGTYTDRYFIAFRDNSSGQDVSETSILSSKDIDLQYNKSTNKLEIRLDYPVLVKAVEIYNQLGQRIMTQSFNEVYSTFSVQLPANFSEVLILKIQSDKGTITKSILL